MTRDNGSVVTPKIIHYCWFGGSPLSEQAERSIASWRKFAPGFVVQQWDESNFDINESPFVKAAYLSKKWAYVSDYARFRILHDYGGIYMDVGTTLIKDISPLLSLSPFTAIERGAKTATPGLIASCAALDSVTAEVLEIYEGLKFEDNYAFLYANTVNQIFTGVLEAHGYVRKDCIQNVAGWTILPTEYFDPRLTRRGFVVAENTYSVHESSGSWAPKSEQLRVRTIRKLTPLLGNYVARKCARVISIVAKKTAFRDDGRLS